MQTLYAFTLRVRHDAGHVTIRTTAQDEAAARAIVCASEHCPDRSIRRVWRGRDILAPRPTRATRVIHELADYARQSGARVDVDSGMSTVSIDGPGQDSIFMQGDEADRFADEVRALCKRYPSLREDVAELAAAKPYIDCLWS